MSGRSRSSSFPICRVLPSPRWNKTFLHSPWPCVRFAAMKLFSHVYINFILAIHLHGRANQLCRVGVCRRWPPMETSFRGSSSFLRLAPRASAYFMLILYRSVTANAVPVPLSPPGVHLLVMSIHGPPTVRSRPDPVIVERVPTAHHSYHDNNSVNFSCMSGPSFLVATTIPVVSATIRAYPAFGVSVGQLV
jgi:hypothetical protein